MDNKYVYAVVGGILLFAWYWVGHQPFYDNEGALSTGYIITAILVLALGGGKSDGTDLVSTITGSFTGFVGKLIGLLIAYLVGTLLYVFLVREGGFDIAPFIETVATLAASGILMVLTMSCLKKSG